MDTEVVIAIITNNQQVLIAERQAHQHLAGCWEFPGGKIEPQETPEQALTRELNEELDIRITEAQYLEQFSYQYPSKNIIFKVFQVTKFTGQPRGNEGQDIAWVPVKRLADYKLPPANQKIVQLVNHLL